MSSDQMLTKSSSNNNNTATTSATSTLPNAEPLPNLNKTTPGWYSQQTRGWPWSSWTRRTTQTNPKPYYKTLTPIKYFQRIPPANLKTNSFPFSRTSNKQEASAPTSMNSYTHQCICPKFYGLPKIYKVGTTLRPLFPVGGPSCMVLPRHFHTSSNPL